VKHSQLRLDDGRQVGTVRRAWGVDSTAGWTVPRGLRTAMTSLCGSHALGKRAFPCSLGTMG
jgi:hypothetical protein